MIVPDDQLSLAIGREGQNARLAAKLTGWRIDIKSLAEAAHESIDRLRNDDYYGEIDVFVTVSDGIMTDTMQFTIIVLPYGNLSTNVEVLFLAVF